MKSILAVLVPVLLPACAHVEELPDGSRRVTGLVSMTIPAAVPHERRGADLLEVTALGVLLLSSPAGTSLSFGYASERIVGVRNDALVTIGEKREPQ